MLKLLLFLALSLPALAQRLSPLAAAPDWRRLEAFDRSITRDECQRLLDEVYAPGGAWQGVVELRETELLIHKTLSPAETMVLTFAPDEKSARKPKQYWRPKEALGVAKKSRPLAGLKIALDPGHIGGEWGRMEGRSFARPGDKPVQEGDMTFTVAKLAAAELRKLGATVSFVREAAKPASTASVDALRPAAKQELELMGFTEYRENYEGERDPQKTLTVQWQAEKLFYRVAEIRERARRVNKVLKPDLVICIHFNASDWGDPDAPTFDPRNDQHTLVHGCYAASELRFDDQRFEMLLKLLNRSHTTELPAAIAVNSALTTATGLPPFRYESANAKALAEGVWARNLLANRLFECPVVFLEPYRMNHEETYARVQAGDYAGEREVAGKMRPSIFREYASGIVEGVKAWR